MDVGKLILFQEKIFPPSFQCKVIQYRRLGFWKAVYTMLYLMLDKSVIKLLIIFKLTLQFLGVFLYISTAYVKPLKRIHKTTAAVDTHFIHSCTHPAENRNLPGALKGSWGGCLCRKGSRLGVALLKPAETGSIPEGQIKIGGRGGNRWKKHHFW